MKIYTRAGDRGMTTLFGGKRVSKASLRLEAYGTVDELNALLGLARSSHAVPTILDQQLVTLQRFLFTLCTDLATPLDSRATVERIDGSMASQLESWIDAMEEALPPLQNFILPAGSVLSTRLHHARTVCRRAERRVISLMEVESITPSIVVVLNRLSDYLFVAARFANAQEGRIDVTVSPGTDRQS